MKSILISIKPEWVRQILNGKKTIEIRKTMPKCDLPIDVYIYCTKDKRQELCWFDGYGYKQTMVNHIHNLPTYNGKVVAKFTLNKVEEITVKKWNIYVENNLLKESCLHESELFHYIGDFRKKPFYAWHIDNLEIFDKPKELSEFTNGKYIFGKNYKLELYKLTKAPQSWCYVEVYDD